MIGWSRFVEQAPELAAAADVLLARNEVAFLATVTAGGRPRVHPFVPRVVDGRLLAFVLDSSPKIDDLRRTGHYAIHLMPGPEDEEFSVTGEAVEITGDPDLRMRTATAMAFATGVDDHHVLFEFRIDRALHTRWLDFGTPGHRPQRRHWRWSGEG